MASPATHVSTPPAAAVEPDAKLGKDPPRRGKWSPEEEAYAARLIHAFDAGVLADLENGATLRAFLSRRLRCSAMRISKKFAGDKCLGKQIYLRHAAAAAEAEAEARALAALEAAFVAAATRQAAAPAKRPRGNAAGPRGRKAPRRPRAPAPAPPPSAAPRHIVSASESVGSGRDADDAASSDDDEAAARRRSESPVRFKRLGSATALDRLGDAGAAPAAACAAFAGEARALAEAHRRAEAAALSDGGGFPGGGGGGLGRPPPAQLLLELAPSGAAAGARAAPGLYALAIARGASSGALSPLGGRARADSHASEGALLLAMSDIPDDFAALHDDGPLDLDDDPAWLDAFDANTPVAQARAA